MRRLGFLLIALTLVAAACGNSDPGTEPTAATSTTTTTTTTAVPSSTTTTSRPATTTSTTEPPTGGSTTTTVAPAPQFVRVYFMIDDLEGAGPFVRPVSRQIEPTVQVARAAMEALIDGPTADEQRGTPAIHGGLPDGTRLLSLTIVGGTARVDLSQEIEDVGGTFGEISVLAQLVFTLTQFPTVDRVTLLIEGEAVEFFGGHGMEVAPSIDRTYFLGGGVVPEILVDTPAWFARSSSPLTVTGTGRLFEATANWALYDNDGLQLAEGFTMASEGGPEWGDFAFAVPFTVDREQLGTLMVWEESAEDGSRQFLAEHPVWLVP